MSRSTTLLLALALLPPLTACAPLVATGLGAGALMVEDRRTAGTYLVDEEIELKAAGRLYDMKLEGVHANFTSYNRRLLITGEAPTAAVKAQVGEMARGVPKVREVVNELAIGLPSGYAARSHDGYITAKVKTRFLDDSRFSAHHVKVLTENKAVYLMGLVKHDESNAAAGIAAKTADVARVVKVFEYLD